MPMSMLYAECMTTRRWDGDRRGSGDGSASGQVPPVHDLMDAMLRADWVTEEPEEHLLPHIKALCEREGSPLRLLSAVSDGPVFVVSLEWTRPAVTARHITSAAYSLLGTFAESHTHIREQTVANAIDFEITTGLLDIDQPPFKGHGHVVRLHVTGAAIESMLHRRL